MFDALGNLVAFRLLGLSPESGLGEAIHFFVMDLAKIFALLVIVVYLMGLLRAMISPERVRALVRGRPDWQARGLAVTLGAMTPFCSCSSVPLFIGFVEVGIPLGVTFSFLIASPMINEVAAEQAGVEIDMEKVTDIAEIMSFGVMSTPGVVVDGKLVHAGGLPAPDDVRRWVTG